MKPERAPVRLLDPRSDAPGAVRDALSAGQAERPSAEVLARLAAKFPPPGPPGGSGAHSRIRDLSPAAQAAPAAAPSILPGVLVGALLGLGAAGALSLWSPDPGALSPARPALTASLLDPGRTGHEPAPARDGVEPASPGTVGAPAPEPPSHDAGPFVPARAATAVSPASPASPAAPAEPIGSSAAGVPEGASGGAPPPSTESESALVQRAQQALASSPASALALANEHLARHPGGRLAQERELIAISALVALGRTGEANARAASFLATFPRSAHRPRVEALAPGALAPAGH